MINFSDATSPFPLFAAWFAAAKAHPAIADATVMCLATSHEDKPSARIVLLKAWDENGFVFYTNLDSRKSRELTDNPQAALCFYWPPLDKQVRVSGSVEKVSDKEADAYFATRERLKQIGAWASKQSEPLASREELVARIQEIEKKYDGKPVPRPPHWSGWRVIPEEIEFWQQGEARLHERLLFRKKGNDWEKTLLYP